MLYNNLDWLAHRWATDMLAPDNTQWEQWRELFKKTADRHRLSHLPDVILLLRALEWQVQRGLNPTDLQCWLDALEASYREHALLVIPLATELLLELDTEQIKHLENEMHHRNQDYRKERLYASAQKQESARLDRYIDRIEDWAGDLTVEQVQIVHKSVAKMPDIAADWLEYREQQQAKLLELLRQGATDVEISDFLSDWWIEYRGRKSVLSDAISRLRQQFIELAIRLDQAFSDDQRNDLIARIEEWREGLEAALGQSNSQESLLLPCASPISRSVKIPWVALKTNTGVGVPYSH